MSLDTPPADAQAQSASGPHSSQQQREYEKYQNAMLDYRCGRRATRPVPSEQLKARLAQEGAERKAARAEYEREQAALRAASHAKQLSYRNAVIAGIQQDNGIDHASAELLYWFRFGETRHLTPSEQLFCEALEQQLATDKAKRVLAARSNGSGDAESYSIDWDAHDARHARSEPPPAGNGHAGTFPEQPQPAPAEPLSYVNLALDLTPREWLVPERIPMCNVTSLSGEGAIGKSLLLLQLSGAVVLGKEWIGTLPEQGPVLYMSAEEDDDEVRRRMEDVARHLGATRSEMTERGLRILSFAGRNAVLAQPDRAAVMRPTPLFEQIRREALQLRPRLIVFDNLADIFAGKEIDRAQTRQFITLLRGLAIEAYSAVVLSAHPSLQGITSDSGLSGSTGWHNSVRARMYFKAAPGDDTSLRVLEVKKNNYGPVSESVVLRWRDGVYVVERVATLDRLAVEAEVDFLFIKLLRRLTEQGRNVSDKVSPSFAPTVFASEPDAKKAKADKRAFAEAMSRLFAARKIRVEPFGPASKMRTRIVEAEGEADPFQRPSNDPSNGLPTTSAHNSNVRTTTARGKETSQTSAFLPTPDASNDLPTPSNGVCAHTPHTPPPVGSGQGALEDAARSNGQEAEEHAELATVLAAWRDAIGIGATSSLDEVIAATDGHPNLKAALLAVAATESGKTISNIRLARWLRDRNRIAVDGVQLVGGGVDGTGSPLWTLTRA